MSIFLKSQWKEWAREWGLAHYPEKGRIHRTEHMVGERRGMLIRVGWGPSESPGLTTCIRFPRVADPAGLREALIQDSSLDVLPGKGSAWRKMAVRTGPPKKIVWVGKPPEFTLNESSLQWRRAFPWRAPKAAQVQAWVDAMVAAVARATRGFDGRCETCGTGSAPKYVLVDDLPVLMCTSCQQRLKSEGEMADRTYDMLEARHVPGALLAVIAALISGVAWAAVGAFTERTFAAAAIGIGVLIALAYQKGAGRVDVAGRVIAACLTLMSVVWGQVLIYTWWVAKARPDIGFNLDAGWYVYLGALKKNAGQEFAALFFGLVGAWVASQALQRPKLHASIEAADAEQKKAA